MFVKYLKVKCIFLLCLLSVTQVLSASASASASASERIPSRLRRSNPTKGSIPRKILDRFEKTMAPFLVGKTKIQRICNELLESNYKGFCNRLAKKLDNLVVGEFAWIYEHHGRWFIFQKKDSSRIEQAYSNWEKNGKTGSGIFGITLSHLKESHSSPSTASYLSPSEDSHQINFRTLEQMNNKTKFKRPIKRLPKKEALLREEWFFHGTGGTCPEPICLSEYGLDMRLGNPNSFYGKAIYGAKDAHYAHYRAHHHCTPEGNSYYQLIVFKACMGESCNYEKNINRELMRPPRKEGSSFHYDSVTGGPFTPTGNHYPEEAEQFLSPIVALYENHQVCPAYIISYSVIEEFSTKALCARLEGHPQAVAQGNVSRVPQQQVLHSRPLPPGVHQTYLAPQQRQAQQPQVQQRQVQQPQVQQPQVQQPQVQQPQVQQPQVQQPQVQQRQAQQQAVSHSVKPKALHQVQTQQRQAQQQAASHSVKPKAPQQVQTQQRQAQQQSVKPQASSKALQDKAPKKKRRLTLSSPPASAGAQPAPCADDIETLFDLLKKAQKDRAKLREGQKIKGPEIDFPD